jgi:hypothetical protein
LFAAQQGMTPFDAATFGNNMAARVLHSPGASLQASLVAKPVDATPR